MNCLEMWRHSDRRKGTVLMKLLLNQHPVTLLRLHSYPVRLSLPLQLAISSRMFLFFKHHHPLAHMHAAKYPEEIIAMRRYWIIIIAIPFNSFQLWSYNSIFGIRAKWVTTTSWNCFIFGSLRNIEQYHASHIHDFNILSSLLCSSSTSLS